MSKTTKALSGAGQKKYFRELLAEHEGLGAELRKTLLAQTEREIAQVRVRLPVPERARRKPDDTAQPAGPRDVAGSADTPAGAAAEGPPAFDPFAFSVVVVMTKEGRDGLAKNLAGIHSVANLYALAKAQHIAVPPGIDDAASLRAAIIEGTAQRIANRRAAGS